MQTESRWQKCHLLFSSISSQNALYLKDRKSKNDLERNTMKQEVSFLLNIIKFLLNGKTGEMPLPHPEMNWERLLRLAQQHSIMNLVYYGTENLPDEYKPNEEIRQQLYKSQVREIVKSYNQIEAIEELLQAFEKEGIYALAVKGACTKRHYPQADMRTMGDVDVLYQAQQQAKVKRVMADLGYENAIEGRKHDHYHRQPYINVEMHRELVAVDSIHNQYYDNVWKMTKARENHQYIQEMRLEDEYIYSIVHLVEHFQNGGIGIRFIMDVYVYNQMAGMDWNYIEKQLKQLGLWKFYGNISQLADRWFGNKVECTQKEKDLLDRLAAYIVSNGTYGTSKNAAAISVASEGKTKFIVKIIFPNLKNMQSMFPWLEKWPILLPVSWGIRGVRSMVLRRENVQHQFDTYKNGDKKHGEELQKFFKVCGL